jgi:hypothetical protein
MRPELTDDELTELQSRAEATVYRALRDQLPDDVLVIHSLRWLYRSPVGRIREGEADFTIFMPTSGFLTIEVKGGGIELDGATGTWLSIDRRNERHQIKDPFRQAQTERFAVLDQLKGHTEWRKWPGRRILCGHAVLFPDLNKSDELEGPDRPRAIIGSQRDIPRLDAWIDGVLRFWATGEQTDPLTQFGVELAERIFCASISVRPPLAVELEHEEAVRIRLTDQQSRVLRILDGRTSAIIGGGAGTGKTLIAVEKARRLAAQGVKTILICYNRRLADTLRAAQKEVSSLHIMSYHQLCQNRINDLRQKSGRDVLAEAKEAFPGADLYDVHLPFALGLANEGPLEKYGAIVVDEAQDFSEDYWLGVEGLRADPVADVFYLFFDPNQVLYQRCGRLPISEVPHWLTMNCRNTSYIHDAVYRYYEGHSIDPPETKGAPISQIKFDTPAEQAQAIAREVGRLNATERIRPQDIAVLVTGRPKQTYYDLLNAQRIAGRIRWGVESDDTTDVLVDTVARYKGLESAIVFLWLSPVVDTAEDRETLYVGLSRAKSRLYLVGTETTCSAVLTPLGNPITT